MCFFFNFLNVKMFLYLILYLCPIVLADSGMRFYISLNGLWQFKLDEYNRGLSDKWFNSRFSDGEYLDMPVPSSFNDITVDRKINNYIGWVWYQKTFYIPSIWINNKHIFLKIGAAHYYTMVWINKILVGEHEGGHVPFVIDLTKSLPHDVEKCVLTIAINNTLNENTIPQGFLVYENDTQKYPQGYQNYNHNFDYFDYAGLNGNVEIYVTNHIYIDDIDYILENTDKGYYVHYSIKILENTTGIDCSVQIIDNEIIDANLGCNGSLKIENPKLWWPIYHKNKTAGYMYTLAITLINGKGEDLDYKDVKIGLREIKWDKTSLHVNNEKIYMRGFGMHQDSEMRGRGFDYVQLSKDIYLLKWMHANTIRTSHYPYFTEFLDLTDKNGIMVILETPACSLSIFDDEIIEKHKQFIKEIWSNYKHHPSIIMWSLANEPLSNKNESDEYFEKLGAYMKTLDTRPVTFVTSQQIYNEKAIQHMDVVSVNRYSGWYQDGGKLDLISYQVSHELTNWHDKYSKPVLMTEYGAGSMAGFHSLPSVMWSEEYQTDLFKEHFKAFDCLRAGGFLLGEMIWNFADFNTPQEYIRPGRCAKGIFTRNRQPKTAAFEVRKRYTKLINNSECNCLGIHNFIDQC